jgi:hypothetical protein
MILAFLSFGVGLVKNGPFVVERGVVGYFPHVLARMLSIQVAVRQR